MQANILIVDDTPDNLHLLVGMLKERGYTIRPASDGQYALATIQAELPDLILLDIMMPGINGYEVCQQLKADEQTHDIPIIFISGLHRTVDKVKAFASGAVDYITKPFQPEEVIARVQTHLTLRKLQQDLQQEVARRKQSEEQLRELNAQLQEANAAKDKFFSIIAHDLRGPMGTFLQLSDLMTEKREGYSKEEIINIMTTQRDSATRLFDLLENLLSWARSQQGRLEYNPQQIDLSTVAAWNVSLLAPQGEQKQITLRNLIEEKIFVYADYHLVATVVRNLISNALKFTRAQGTIEVCATPNGRYIEIAVSDTGIGIPEEALPKLFRLDARYKQIGTANERGTGLGLLLCKEFVERHGGSIWLESEAGKGTTVRFTLPKKCLH